MISVNTIHALLAQHQIKGFLPEHEAEALYRMACQQAPKGVLLEVGSFCGRSAVYLGHAAASFGQTVFSVDHHIGSEEHQKGEGYHDVAHYDAEANRVDTLPDFRRTLRVCGMDDVVMPIVARSEALAKVWTTPLAFMFIDGGHSLEQATADCLGWAKHLAADGVLAIHDIFENPEDGGQAPFLAMQAAIEAFGLVQVEREGSLVFLMRKPMDAQVSSQ